MQANTTDREDRPADPATTNALATDTNATDHFALWDDIGGSD